MIENVQAEGARTQTGARHAVSPVMGALIAEHDWAKTSLGSSRSWPLVLQATVDIVLASRFPMVFWWGPDLIQIYNDAYLPIIGDKHPAALGQTARECWAEIWDVIGPQIESIQNGGPATWNEDVLLDINRHGFTGELYFTWSYSPLPNSTVGGGVGGVLCTVQETTQKVIGERRILLLRDLAAFGSEAKSAEEECRIAGETMARYEKSVPFSVIYLSDEAGRKARLVGHSGVRADRLPLPAEVVLSELPAPFVEALETDALVHVERLEDVVGAIPHGPWPEPPREGAVVAIPSGIAGEPAGFLFSGINPRERFDEGYRSFLLLLAGQLAAALSSSRAFETERRRAEALAELDRAKIEFFSNISHEFRTPLTLMLGPLERLLRDSGGHDRELLETAHRNSLRLLKLVNTLLEFSRLEAGRSDATYVRTDLAASTRDLCSLFTSAIEAAGLRFVLAIEDLEPVYVDGTMWEMIVLNLLSNALKFTHRGEIGVTLHARGKMAELTVRDSGIGIPHEDLPFVFERFHRVRGDSSRSHEGTGIGLALVEEFVRLHGGTIEVTSDVGRGSAFTVRIPFGSEHLDLAAIAPAPAAPPQRRVADQFLADLESTIRRTDPQPAREPIEAAAHVLVADDNSDLRAYLTRILGARHAVTAVTSGLEALEVLRTQRVDLLVSDVMMPQMDGFELIEAIRSDPRLESLPVVLLSARAGEGSAIEGLSRGADDYLVKPFGADELLARVSAQLNAAAIRERSTRGLRESEERF